MPAEQVTRYPAPSLLYIVRPLAAGHRLVEGIVDCALARPCTAVKLTKNVMPIMAKLELAVPMLLHPRCRGGYIAVDVSMSCCDGTKLLIQNFNSSIPLLSTGTDGRSQSRLVQNCLGSWWHEESE